MRHNRLRSATKLQSRRESIRRDINGLRKAYDIAPRNEVGQKVAWVTFCAFDAYGDHGRNTACVNLTDEIVAAMIGALGAEYEQATREMRQLGIVFDD